MDERVYERGDHAILHSDVDPGSGFGYGLALVDPDRIADTEHSRNHLKYVLEGKRSNCITGAVVSH